MTEGKPVERRREEAQFGVLDQVADDDGVGCVLPRLLNPACCPILVAELAFVAVPLGPPPDPP
jgi:hypothetical protein